MVDFVVDNNKPASGENSQLSFSEPVVHVAGLLEGHEGKLAVHASLANLRFPVLQVLSAHVSPVSFHLHVLWSVLLVRATLSTAVTGDFHHHLLGGLSGLFSYHLSRSFVSL